MGTTLKILNSETPGVRKANAHDYTNSEILNRKKRLKSVWKI